MTPMWALLLVCVVNGLLALGGDLKGSCINNIDSNATKERWKKIPVDLVDGDESKQMKEYVELAIARINRQKALALESPDGQQLQDQLLRVYAKVELGFSFCLEFTAKSFANCSSEVTDSCSKMYRCSAEIEPSFFLTHGAPQNTVELGGVYCALEE